MKKTNILKVNKNIFRLIVLITITAFVALNFIKLNQGISVNGLVSLEDNHVILEFNILEKNFEKFKIGNEIILRDYPSNNSFSGKILKIDILDIGLDEGKIIKYKIEIDESYSKYTMKKFYSFNIIMKNKMSLIDLYLLK